MTIAMEGRGRRHQLPPRWLTLAIGYGLLMVAWAVANPPFATPDEPTNLIKAVAVGRGELDGPRVAPLAAGPYENALQAAWGNEQSRAFVIPAGLVPPQDVCFIYQPDTTADCLRAPAPPDPARLVDTYSYDGTYPPLAYIMPGLVVRLASDVLQADYLGRLAIALVCAGLLGAAAWVLSRASSTALAGLVLAATPMVVFHASGLAPTGVEICAAICFAASLIGLTREEPPPGVPAVLGVSGAVLALTRPLGVVYVCALALSALPLLRPGTLRRRPVVLAALTVVLAAAFAITWLLFHEQLNQFAAASVLSGLGQPIAQSPDLEFDIVGIFGWDDTYMPTLLYNLWWILFLVVVVAALVVAAWRERLSLLAAMASTELVAAAVYGLVLSPAWWRLEARWLLPLLAMVLLVAAHALRSARRLPPGAWLAVATFVAALQFLALWYNERRYAVGRDGPFLFFDAARWSPPSGWLLPFALAVLGALLIAASFVPQLGRRLVSPPME